jgi:glucose-6-phosphate 1-dehydrogenase
VLVIFGGRGDLARRKLLPALHHLHTEGFLPDAFAVIAVATRELDDASFREFMMPEVRAHLGDGADDDTLSWLEERLYYISGDLRDGAFYARLTERIEEVRERHDTGSGVLFYLATPPSFFQPAIDELGRAGLVEEREGFRRVIVEKPFGRDLESARTLNRTMQETLDEKQIYRIDHYLGKETVQNLLVFRFANGIFEPVWNRRYVDHVQITVAEDLGIGTRGRYYEESGALRDMVPNHIFQLLGYVAMEPPTSFDAEAVRDEKKKVFQAIQPLDPDDVLRDTVRGQYAAGHDGEGEAVLGYREEDEVAADSPVETYAAMKLMVDNWRWGGVPFYLRTGKRLPKRVSQVVIQFKKVPFMLFRETPVEALEPNRLVIRVQPREGIALRFGAKIPGTALRLGAVDMDFCYADVFGKQATTGYETLLYDAMNGDATYFQRGDNVEAAWGIVAPVLDVWSAIPPREFPNYEAGTWGPSDAEDLLERDGRSWHDPE